MFQPPTIISDERVSLLTPQQLRHVYKQRLAKWMEIAGYTSAKRYFKASGGARWDEFRTDWLSGKITILASELPEIDDLVDDAPMDYAAVERAMDDYAVLWLVTHGEQHPSSQRFG